MTLLFSAKNVLKADSDDATSDDVIVAVMSFFHPPASSSSLLSFFQSVGASVFSFGSFRWKLHFIG